MAAILSLALLLICAALLVANFRDIKKTHNPNG